MSLLESIFGARDDGQSDLVDVLESRIADLELALEDVGWLRLGASLDFEFSRHGLSRIVELARAMYIKNPLIKRGVELQKLYVFGRGFTVDCDDEDARAAARDFLDDHGNARALTGEQAIGEAEKELKVTGNLFLACFKAKVSPQPMAVRIIRMEEIDSIIRNPEDSSEPWFYKRIWTEQRIDPGSGSIGAAQRTAYYPAHDYRPSDQVDTIGGHPVMWNAPIVHVKVGCFPHWEFGVSEVYSSIDWARMHTENLQNWARVTESLASFAWRMRSSGAKGVAAAKAKLATSDAKPGPPAGSVYIGTDGQQLEPLRTAGATSSPSDSRFLLLQVAAGLGLPEIFFGNADVGNHASAKVLDRPTEMMMMERQSLWRGTLRTLIDLALEDRGITPSEPVSVNFPDILEHDIDAAMSALVKGLTLDGKEPVVVPDMRTVADMVFKLLEVEDADAVLDRLFPEGGSPAEQVTQAEGALIAALSDLRESIAGIVTEGADE